MKFILFLFAVVVIATITSVAVARPQRDAMKDEISFSNDVQPIMNNFCTTCHAGDDPAGDLVLTGYDDVRDMVEDGTLLDRINDADDPMPPSGLMPKHMRRMVKIWSETDYINEGKARGESGRPAINYGDFVPPKITPVGLDENEVAIELLEEMQGHWVGSMWLMGQEWEWMAFDFRPIASSHVHGIFEGGTIGNLFTSFFVTNFQGKRTIMARNGGLLNGIYRTSYFVLDKVEKRKGEGGEDETYFRLVDAYGGKEIMYMELTFSSNSIAFNAYTSRMGLNVPPKPHMQFQGQKMHLELAENAAKKLEFPSKEIDIDFADGLPKPNWGSDDIPQTSASYLWEEPGLTLEELAKVAKDPYPIGKMPHVAKLTVSAERNALIADKPLMIYLSSKSLTHENGKFVTEFGYLSEDVGNSILMFPQITGSTNEFTFTYLHPGDYYLTVIADMDGDSMPSPGDIAHASQEIKVEPESHETVKVKEIRVRN